jgi:crotonobetainyl-CoA:carnitine CoA-transferase CaiB-like acyl-CoA transferase
MSRAPQHRTPGGAAADACGAERREVDLPLRGLTVLEFGQYLSGPSAGLRLADLGARVIKIERPGLGDPCRRLSIKNLWTGDGNSLLFHTINRNKESLEADLKSPEDKAWLLRLVAEADVLLHNFRPGVMEAVGLGYDDARRVNPRLVYAVISGFGAEGPWRGKPGQDLLLQSMSGLTYTTGNGGDHPVPFGLSIADTLAGTHLVQGILGGLIRRHKTGKGALVEVSMMASLVDFQFELMTTYLNGGRLPQRSEVSNGNPLLSAPYGIYATADGFVAIAMVDLHRLGSVIGCAALTEVVPGDEFVRRDGIKTLLAAHLAGRPSAHWLALMQAEDLWAMEVLDWHGLTTADGYRALEMEQDLTLGPGLRVRTTRCPIRLDGHKLTSAKAAPALGADTPAIRAGIGESAADLGGGAAGEDAAGLGGGTAGEDAASGAPEGDEQTLTT